MELLTAERLRQVIEYDPETGDFRWRIRSSYRVSVGDSAGDIVGGYRRIGFGGKKYWAARLAWLYVYGAWPQGQVDHKDGDPLNNRMSNLRDVSHAVNQQNKRRPNTGNSLGLLGVSLHPKSGRFQARITINGKSKNLGSFAGATEAHQAYLVAKRKLHDGCTI